MRAHLVTLSFNIEKPISLKREILFMNSFDFKKPFFENISTKCCILWNNGKVIYKKIDKNAKNVPSIPGGKEI